MRWLAADEIAAMLDRSTHAVYCLANRQRWPRKRRAGRIFYDPAGVAASLPDIGDVLRHTPTHD